MWTWAATALGASWTVDGTSFDAPSGTWPVTTGTVCPAPRDDAPRLDGAPLTTLGVAVVVYSRKHATMAWGHASLRATYCLGDRVVDHEYETYRLSGWNERMLALEHPGEAFLTDGWLRTQRGALVLFRNVDPVDGGAYAEAQRHNREIYELWLDLPQAELDAVVLEAERWWTDQREALRAHAPLEGRYVPWTTNCTTVWKALVPEAYQVDSALPFAWLRELERRELPRVLHPSAHLLARWGTPPATTTRPHPVFRRRARALSSRGDASS